MGRKNNRNTRKNLVLKFKNFKGISVVEVLVAVAILGLLTILAVTIFNPKVQIAKARDARKQSDLKRIAIALEDYIGDNPCYPEESVMTTGDCGNANLKPYLNSMPCDPDTNRLYTYVRPPPTCDKYVLFANLTTKSSSVSYTGGSGNYVVTSPNYRLIPTVIIGGGVGSPSEGAAEVEYWGCFSGICVQVPSQYCSPTYTDASGNCSNQCRDSVTGAFINQCD